jgi:hypothetical protein
MNSRIQRFFLASVAAWSIVAIAGSLPNPANAKSLKAGPTSGQAQYLGPKTSGYQSACQGKYSHCILSSPTSAPFASPNPGGLLLPLPSDRRLKRDVVLLGDARNGIAFYRFKYTWSDQVYVGVMAQQVAAIVPEAVHPGADGFLRVDYNRLGLRMQTWDEWRAANADSASNM